ncbi:unnamed protein product [Trichogramma brassicae]|uniref:Uncharacterized protein n=1 Tax=Trichogramma brassicae TaxID=86971 RepID=A0A6H5I3E0_9HYME|nr:unnamed protein product [Trichogramma brassicae]
MSKFWTFCTIFAALYSIIVVGSVSPLKRLSKGMSFCTLGENDLVLSESGVEYHTVYYALCDRSIEATKRECTLYRNKFYGKDAECNITLRSESGGIILTNLIAIEPLGRDRAIVRWFERKFTPFMYFYNKSFDTSHLRFSIVNLTNCKVKTTKLSEDLDRLIKKDKLIIFQIITMAIAYENCNVPRCKTCTKTTLQRRVLTIKSACATATRQSHRADTSACTYTSRLASRIIKIFETNTFFIRKIYIFHHFTCT